MKINIACKRIAAPGLALPGAAISGGTTLSIIDATLSLWIQTQSAESGTQNQNQLFRCQKAGKRLPALHAHPMPLAQLMGGGRTLQNAVKASSKPPMATSGATQIEVMT